MKASIESNRPWITTDAVAHTAPVRVLVGDRPIRSAKDATELIAILRMQREYYRINGRYEKGGHRLRVLKLFDEAIGALGRRQ
jgi:hypothetical protein